MRTDNPENDYQNHINNQTELDSEYKEFDEWYRMECEKINKRIEDAKKDKFERFRDRFINGMDKFLTKIN